MKKRTENKAEKQIVYVAYHYRDVFVISFGIRHCLPARCTSSNWNVLKILTCLKVSCKGEKEHVNRLAIFVCQFWLFYRNPCHLVLSLSLPPSFSFSLSYFLLLVFFVFSVCNNFVSYRRLFHWSWLFICLAISGNKLRLNMNFIRGESISNL